MFTNDLFTLQKYVITSTGDDSKYQVIFNKSTAHYFVYNMSEEHLKIYVRANRYERL